MLNKAFGAVALLLALSNSAHAMLLTLEPAVQLAATGDTVTLDLRLSGLGAGTAPSLGGFDIDIGYDPLALSILDPIKPYSLGLGLGDFSFGEAFDFSFGDLGGGLINVRVVSLLENDSFSCFFCVAPYLEDLQTDSLVLASFEFSVDALALGSSTGVVFDTVYGLSDGFGSALSFTTRDAEIRNPDVIAVPAPASIALLMLGFLAMGFTSHRNVQKR